MLTCKHTNKFKIYIRKDRIIFKISNFKAQIVSNQVQNPNIKLTFCDFDIWI